MNTANLQLEGMVMALASLCETLADRDVLEHKEIGAALERARSAVEQDDTHQLSEANQAAVLFRSTS